jgi:CRISP-associated protein Cas1
MQLILDTEGLFLNAYRGAFQIKKDDIVKRISPKKITSIAITANVLIQSAAVKLAVENQIPILFFDNIGKAKALLWSPYFENIATLRRQQIGFANSTKATEWFIDLFELKSMTQINVLEYLQRRRTAQKDNLGITIGYIKNQTKKFEPYRAEIIADCRNNLMGIEGSIAAMYWKAVAAAMPEPYSFEKRSRRPANDLFNAVLNYLYGMTYTVVEGGIFAAGLDPYLGFIHVDEHKKPTLTFDVIEPFRPWLDRLLIEECLKGNIQENFVTKNQHGLFLNKTGKAYIIPLFNDFMEQLRFFQERRISNKNHIYTIAGQLAKSIRTFEEDDL